MNKENKNMIKNIVGIMLIITIVFLGGMYGAQVVDTMLKRNIPNVEQDTTDIFDKKQVVRTKEDTDFTGTTQGDTTIHDTILENIEPDFIYYDTIEMKREADSIDAYLKYWYEVLDTNSDGEIDDNIINYEMGCGGEVHDSIIEWLEE